MLLTNISLLSGDERFQYVVEYVRTEYDSRDLNNEPIGCLNGVVVDDKVAVEDIIFVNKDQQTHPIKHINHWYNISLGDKNILDWNIPENYNGSYIRLYFPRHSVETYTVDNKYALTVGTWICGRYIIIGTYIIDRYDALACPGVKKFFDEQYHEYVELPIIDPMDLIYSDDWKLWRQSMCQEPYETDLINSVGSILYCTLHAVIETEDGYIKNNSVLGGQNSINLTQNVNDFLNLTISTNTNRALKRNERPSIECKLGFNNYYQGDFREYMLETYGLDNFLVRYELVVGDDKDMYAICTSPEFDVYSDMNLTSYSFSKDVINEMNFKNGTGWRSGIQIKCSMEILDDDKEPILTLMSNSLPFTPQLFKYFVDSDFKDEFGYVVNNVNLDYVDMKIFNINAVNKTENQIISVDHQFENKSNFNQTTFYRVTDSYSIFLYPEVNDNICLNLDKYKHLVNTFILQIGSTKFPEIGRVQSGVIFKITGNKLPKNASSGRYYILDQNMNLVTSGQYTYKE